MPDYAEPLTRWTIRAALALYAASSSVQLGERGDDRRRRAARWLWTIGWVAYLAHVGAAFQFYHGWSHARAWDETARQTAALLGWHTGGGLWVNYAFTLVWLADAAWWWLVGTARYANRPRWQTAALHGFFIFLIVNGAIVFGAGAVRWGAVAMLLLLALLWLAAHRATSPRT